MAVAETFTPPRTKPRPLARIEPVRMVKSGRKDFIPRLLIGTPSRGTVRIEWHAAVRSMAIPPNWASMQMHHVVNEFIPIEYTVADGQNIITREAVGGGYDWLLLLEDDVIPPPDALVRLAKYMEMENPYPVVSGLYCLKSRPTEPVLYRGHGNGSFRDFKVGQKVWVDGVPTGFLLINSRLLRVVWNESPEYSALGEKTRRVFESPASAFISPEGQVRAATGTSDLEWCRRVIEDGLLKKAGWPNIQRKKYPFLCDTAIFCHHIAIDGTIFP